MNKTRNLVVFIDGTNQDRSKEETSEESNVIRIYKACQEVRTGDAQQYKFYRDGVGTRSHEALAGGALGYGLDERVGEALIWLRQELQYAAEDGFETRVFLFGFSRGAFAVRWLATLIKQGITFLGVWDTVKAAPTFRVDISPLPAHVKVAFHAMALDEHREIFNVYRLIPSPSVTELWFSGCHSDVGGGYKERKLADVSLAWMAQHAAEHGLLLDPSVDLTEAHSALKSEPVMHDENTWGWKFLNLFCASHKKVFQRSVRPQDYLHPSVQAIAIQWPALIRNPSVTALLSPHSILSTDAQHA